MARIDETIVREYFEGNGFLVRRLRGGEGEKKKSDREEDRFLLVMNPIKESGTGEASFMVFSSELRLIRRAVVVIRNWPTVRISPGVIRSGPKLARLVQQGLGKRETIVVPTEAMARDEEEDGEKVPRLLLVPAFPPAEPWRGETIAWLRERGIDGMLSFRSMLSEIVARIDGGRESLGTEAMEMIRVLKNYDMISDAQMELFRSE